MDDMQIRSKYKIFYTSQRTLKVSDRLQTDLE